jgi:hypothetical protein
VNNSSVNFSVARFLKNHGAANLNHAAQSFVRQRATHRALPVSHTSNLGESEDLAWKDVVKENFLGHVGLCIPRLKGAGLQVAESSVVGCEQRAFDGVEVNATCRRQVKQRLEISERFEALDNGLTGCHGCYVDRTLRNKDSRAGGGQP